MVGTPNRLSRGELRQSNLINVNRSTRSQPSSSSNETSSENDNTRARFGQRAANFGLHNQATAIQADTQPSPEFLNSIRTASQTPQALQQGRVLSAGIEGLGKMLAQADAELNKKDDKESSRKNNSNSTCTDCQAQNTQTQTESAPEPEIELDTDSGESDA